MSDLKKGLVTPSFSGLMSPEDKQKLDGLISPQPGQSQDVFYHHCIPSGASGTNTFLSVEESDTSFVVKWRSLINFARFNLPETSLQGTLYVRGFVDSGTGEIRLRNVTDATTFTTISYTELVNTTKQQGLSSLPSTGVKIVELQMRNTAGGKFTVDTADFDMFQEAV